MPQGRWVPLHEDVKVPVVKNILYAAKIMYKSDKVIMPAAVFAQTSYFVFVNFFQAVLFLKVLLSLIEGNASFSYYVRILLAFVGLSMLNEVIVVGCDLEAAAMCIDVCLHVSHLFGTTLHSRCEHLLQQGSGCVGSLCHHA